MRSVPVKLAVLCAVLVSGVLRAGATNELDALKTGYAAEKARITSAYEQQKANAVAVYRQSVDTLMVDVKQKGELDDYLALTAEKKRVAAEGTVKTNAAPALSGLVAQYQKTLQDAAGARDKANVNLQRLFVAHLTTLMQNDTRADRLDDARAVKDELQVAKTDLTFLEADAPEEPAKPPSAKPQAAASTPEADDAAKSVPGTWAFTWRNMGRSGTDTIVLDADGTASCPKDGLAGRWEVKERQCTIHWPATVNTLTISSDGKRMTGHTRQGSALSAVKTVP